MIKLLSEAKDKYDHVQELFDKSYEKLESVGGRVLERVISSYLFHEK